MILTIDIGNTNIILGGFDEDTLCFSSRISTDINKTEDEYAACIKSVLSLYGVDPSDINGAIISSVVPPLNDAIKKAISFLFSVEALVVGPGVKSGINIHCDTPSSVGSDIICACVAVKKLYSLPALIVDMGTATKISLLDKNGTFVGVSIAPGVTMGLNALSEDTAQLPKISLSDPSAVIAKNTVDSMKSGVVFGHASMIDGMIERINEELGDEPSVYATGGLAHDIMKHCKHSFTLDEHLVLKGLNIIYGKNK